MYLPFEQFPALSAIKICHHVFAQRIPGIDVSHDKAEVLERLDAAHREIRKQTAFGTCRVSAAHRSPEIKWPVWSSQDGSLHPGELLGAGFPPWTASSAH